MPRRSVWWAWPSSSDVHCARATARQSARRTARLPLPAAGAGSAPHESGGEGQLSPAAIGKVESSLVRSAFMRMVLKLNEAAFRPLFMRMFDWAVLDLVDDADEDAAAADGVVARQVVLFKTFNALSETLRSLVSSYYSTLLDQVVELLSGWSKLSRSPAAGSVQAELWCTSCVRSSSRPRTTRESSGTPRVWRASLRTLLLTR